MSCALVWIKSYTHAKADKLYRDAFLVRDYSHRLALPEQIYKNVL